MDFLSRLMGLEEELTVAIRAIRQAQIQRSNYPLEFNSDNDIDVLTGITEGSEETQETIKFYVNYLTRTGGAFGSISRLAKYIKDEGRLLDESGSPKRSTVESISRYLRDASKGPKKGSKGPSKENAYYRCLEKLYFEFKPQEGNSYENPIYQLNRALNILIPSNDQEHSVIASEWILIAPSHEEKLLFNVSEINIGGSKHSQFTWKRRYSSKNVTTIMKCTAIKIPKNGILIIGIELNKNSSPIIEILAFQVQKNSNHAYGYSLRLGTEKEPILTKIYVRDSAFRRNFDDDSLTSHEPSYFTRSGNPLLVEGNKRTPLNLTPVIKKLSSFGYDAEWKNILIEKI